MLWGSTGSHVLRLPTGVLIDSLRGSSHKQHQLQTCEERSLQMVLAPTCWVTPAQSFPAGSPDIVMQKTDVPIMLFTNSWFTESGSTIKWLLFTPSSLGGLFHGIRHMDISLAPLLSTVDIGGLFRQERTPLRFLRHCTKKSTLWNHLLIKWNSRLDYSDRSRWAKKWWCSPPVYLCW